jgi:hypothetical protein
MKNIINTLFSIFFTIAIGMHIKYLIDGDESSVWWHISYFITYGTCWAIIFSKYKWSYLLFAVMAFFPFSTHIYYGYQHFYALDSMFWVCILVCLLLILGVFWVKNNQKI